MMHDEILVDVTRLVWRAWRGRHPTGIDRVCAAYVEHFRDRARAVVQRKGLVFVLSRRDSRRAFDLLLGGRNTSRLAMATNLGGAVPSARRAPPRRGMLYLNVGHTGLNDASLPQWIARHEVRAVHLIHDLIPISHPAFCRPGETERHSERIANALDCATGIIANSQSTIAEIANFAALRSVRMPAHVAAWICGFVEKGTVSPKTLGRPYFVMVGTIEARKNHLLLLQIWRHLVAELGKATPLLVIIGQPGWEAEEALEILAQPGDL